jgi:preprotein translocase subunit YajC
MLYFLTEAGAGAAAGAGMGTTILMLVGMLAVFYFMMIRPENKRKKEAEQMRSNMKVGDEVVTIGGICGKVVHIKDDKFVIETSADQVRIEFGKWALSTNESGAARAKEEAQKTAEAKAKAKAEKKAAKGK